MNKPIKQLERAVEIVAQLRNPTSGCPWDLKQTHETLTKYLIEECFELIEAIEEKNVDSIKEEIGDVLLQVLLHSQIASDHHHFTLEDVAQTLSDKLIYRHPHVFNSSENEKLSVDQVAIKWQELKGKEKSGQGPLMDRNLLKHPALIAATKIGKRSADFNFDWDHIDDVFKKVEEEFLELKSAWNKQNQEEIIDEMGDLYFSLTQLSRHLNLEAEEVLRKANKKFLNRFEKLQTAIEADGKEMRELPTKQLEIYWQKIKKI